MRDSAQVSDPLKQAKFRNDPTGDTMNLFRNRIESGRRLALQLMQFKGTPNLIVLGLPRGGVSVAREVAFALNAPLDVLIVRKLGVPGNEELAMGAIARGIRVVDTECLQVYGVTETDLARVEEQERRELERRESLYRHHRAPLNLRDKTVILIDDGLATGATMKAAILAAKTHNPTKIIVALPVAPVDRVDQIRSIVDELVTLSTPRIFYGVGMFYDDFTQVSDEEVLQMLRTTRGDVIEDEEEAAKGKASFETLSRYSHNHPEGMQARA